MARPRAGAALSEGKRINIRVSDAVDARLDRLVERSECENRTEVIRRALSIYEELLELRAQGTALYLVREDGELERILIM